MKKNSMMLPPVLILILLSQNLCAQNSMTGDGFGGRLWYKPMNYTVGSYSGYTVCGAEMQLYGWGRNSYNQLGHPGITGTVVPVKVNGIDKVKYYSTGYLMAAIKTDQSGWVWGKMIQEGQKVIEDIKFVDAGASNCAFVKNDGTVWSVGECKFGEFGAGFQTQNFSSVPVQMKNITTAVRTAQGLHNTIVLLENGEVMSCGSNAYGGLGNGSPLGDKSTEPVQVSNLSDIIDIKANTWGLIALDKNGDVWVWGLQNSNMNVPLKHANLSNIVAISGCNDGFHFMALDENKNCFAWGDNTYGQCGDGTGNKLYQPKIVATDVIDIMAGEWFSYIVKSDKTLWSSGFADQIWLDLPVTQRSEFTKLNPAHEDIGLCSPKGYTEVQEGANIVVDSSKIEIPHTIYFPNAFTPNSDNINNIFRAIVKPDVSIEKFSLIIVNRNGQVMFKTNNISKGWNGKFQNQDAEISTYFYYAEYNQPNRIKQSLQGDLVLIR